jgi:hypothetical protein
MMTARQRSHRAYEKRWHRSPYEHGERGFSAGKVPIEHRVIQSAPPSSPHITSSRFSWDWDFSDPLELYELADFLSELEVGAPFIAPHSNREAV